MENMKLYKRIDREADEAVKEDTKRSLHSKKGPRCRIWEEIPASVKFSAQDYHGVMGMSCRKKI